ncbi:DUF418 domain-containing protein [Luteipulveratus mongoliensis]|uniref:DUF418 domain-containing protein n=1 Tax=Luteipulveratus mongoliensis TaxID=571913 RepID=A0A0K1JFN6_9MICO|nr:DUF418 domain-containing protein [Luteipulveratus mongoliensis]AKU15405.1 hypothetical protein VV02_05205 [Luteipulveratus mongoliensis]
MTTTTAPVQRGPVLRTERSLAPDLTRGAMLLFIALANAANCAFASQPGIDPTPHGFQRVINFLMVTLVDSRAYPVFAVMFGYGLIQIARRQEAAGTDARRVLLRRNGFLVAFGLVHATLLYFGDFLGAYGIVGILATLLLVRRSDKFHRISVALWGIQLVYVVLTALPVLSNTPGNATITNTTNNSLANSSYIGSMMDRIAEWPMHTVTVIPIIVIVWSGMWAARKGILENPAAHTRLLKGVAAVGLSVTVLSALPYAAVAGGWLHVDAASVDAMAQLHAVGGQFGGPGYVALITLIALRISNNRKPNEFVRSVSALGQRSMTGYLFQSVCWVLIFAPFALDLGGSTEIAVLAAVGVWALSLVGARAMDRSGYRGPAEMALRRLVYKPQGQR